MENKKVEELANKIEENIKEIQSLGYRISFNLDGCDNSVITLVIDDNNKYVTITNDY